MTHQRDVNNDSAQPAPGSVEYLNPGEVLLRWGPSELDRHLYGRARQLLEETSQGIAFLREHQQPIPPEAVELLDVFTAACRWFEQLFSKDS